jgi:hypothetical protein
VLVLSCTTHLSLSLSFIGALRYYPQRLGQVLLVAPPPFVFEAAWKVNNSWESGFRAPPPKN